MFYYLKEKPENPCEKCKDKCHGLCTDKIQYDAISKLIPVDLEEHFVWYEQYRRNWRSNYNVKESKHYHTDMMTFEQFIQQQMNLSNKSNSSEEGKDADR